MAKFVFCQISSKRAYPITFYGFDGLFWELCLLSEKVKTDLFIFLYTPFKKFHSYCLCLKFYIALKVFPLTFNKKLRLKNIFSKKKQI